MLNSAHICESYFLFAAQNEKVYKNLIIKKEGFCDLF